MKLADRATKKLSSHFRQAQLSMKPHRITKLTMAKRKQGQKCSSTTIQFIIIISYPLTARVVGAPEMSWHQFPPFFSSQLPSGTWQTPGLSIPWCCLPTSSCLPCLLPPFTVPSKMIFARPDEWETCPYHCSFRLFTMGRSKCDGMVQDTSVS